MYATHLCKESVDKEIEEAAEYFVPHKNGNVEVGDDNGAVVLEAVLPVPGGSQH
jgi:hypothetical protein